MRVVAGIVIRARRDHGTVDVAAGNRRDRAFADAEQQRAVGMEDQVQFAVGKVVVGAGIQQRGAGAVLAGQNIAGYAKLAITTGR